MALSVRPPVAPMLAKLADEVPEGEGWRYEPKWDGIRALAFRDGPGVVLRSRDDRPLERYFPEVVTLLGEPSSDGWAIDGEIILVRPWGLAFDELLQRIHPAESRVRRLAAEWPATLIIFDILARDGRDLRGASTDARRAELEALAVELGIGPAPDRLSDLPPGPSWLLTPRTTDPEQARRWYADEEGIGQDGLIARRGEDPYREGKRAMLKIKHRRTVDCVVAGYRVAKSGDGVGSLLLGLFDGGELQYVGHTSSFRAAGRRKLLEDLQPYAGDGGFGEGRTPGGPSRWTGGRDTAWVPLRPELVCEVSFDRMQGVRFRHAATFIRWRPERPGSCTFDQLSSRR
jgi:ATP-dependent DNA ligase